MSIRSNELAVPTHVRGIWPITFARTLTLLLAFTINSLAHAGLLSVENGSGSGTFQNGELVYVFADPSDTMAAGDANAEPASPFPVLRIFDRWVGQTEFMEDPLSPETTVRMPSFDVTVKAEYKDASPWTIPSVLTYIPQEHIGVIFLFHGKDGCASCIANAVVMKPFITEAIARGYGIVIPEKLRHEEPTWDSEPEPDLNVDMVRISGIRKDLIDRGRIYESDPIYLMGLSAGGNFASLFDETAQLALDFPVDSMVLVLSPGYPDKMAVSEVPTLLALAENDTNLNLDAGLTVFHSLVSRDVTAQAVIARAMPIHSHYFWSIDGINATDSQAIVGALDNAGFLNGQGFLVDNPRYLNWQAIIPAPFNEPNFEGAINGYLFQAYAEHMMRDTFVNRIFSFIENPATRVEFVPKISTFSPGSGAAGTQVEINGKYFVDIESVAFNGVEATFVQEQSHVLTAWVPVGVSTGPISVSNRAGTAVSSTNFGLETVTVSSMEPQSGPYGTVVEFIGTGLPDTQTVSFNGLDADFAVTGLNSLSASVPTGAVDGPVVVTTSNGSVVAGEFDVLSPPIVSLVSPNRSVAVGERVAIQGENFAATTEVNLQNNAGSISAAFNVISDQEIEMTVPVGAPRWSKVIVTTPYGSIAAPGYFGTL